MKISLFSFTTMAMMHTWSVVADLPIGTAVISVEEQVEWWKGLPDVERSTLETLFDENWWLSLGAEDRAAYAHLASSLYKFVRNGTDSDPTDHYQGFAPLLLRTSFHSGGTYHKPTGTGGANGGTIFHQGELDDDQNGCIETATTQLMNLLYGNNVAMADAVVVAGSVALGVMEVVRGLLRRSFHWYTFIYLLLILFFSPRILSIFSLCCSQVPSHGSC